MTVYSKTEGVRRHKEERTYSSEVFPLLVREAAPTVVMGRGRPSSGIGSLVCQNPDSLDYERKLGVEIRENLRPIHATPNANAKVHRWSPYIQGFAASFVRDTIRDFQNGKTICVLDPFVGSGTVAIQAKMMGVDSCGVEFNPLLHFVAKTKSEAHLADSGLLRQAAQQAVKCRKSAQARIFWPAASNSGKMSYPSWKN